MPLEGLHDVSRLGDVPVVVWHLPSGQKLVRLRRTLPPLLLSSHLHDCTHLIRVLLIQVSMQHQRLRLDLFC